VTLDLAALADDVSASELCSKGSGIPIVEQTAQCPFLAHRVGSLHCTISCGAANLERKKFCGDCGAPVPMPVRAGYMPV